MRTSAWLGAMAVVLAACTSDMITIGPLEPSDFGLPGGSLTMAEIRGTVFLGPDPIEGYEAWVTVFRDSTATRRLAELPVSDLGTYSWTTAAHVLCDEGPSFAEARYRDESDTWRRSAVQLWYTPVPWECVGRPTLRAEDIVIPLP